MADLRRLSVVIASYNACGPLRQTLRALFDSAPGVDTIVVDGGSDGSADMVRREFPEVRLHLHRNHGWAHATNRGLEVARNEYLLLLNSDLFVTRAALDSMMVRLEKDPRLCAVAPTMVNPDGTRQRPFGWLHWPNWLPIRQAVRVPKVSFACLMTRRRVLHHVGALDETFFLYNEELEWCMRAHRAGLHLEQVPERVVHLGGASTPRDPNLVFELQRGYCYMLSRHYPALFSEVVRRTMMLEGWWYGRVASSAERREMWRRFEDQLRRRAFAESTFPLSGRGARCASPEWAQENIGREREGVLELVRKAPIAARRTSSI